MSDEVCLIVYRIEPTKAPRIISPVSVSYLVLQRSHFRDHSAFYIIHTNTTIRTTFQHFQRPFLSFLCTPCNSIARQRLGGYLIHSRGSMAHGMGIVGSWNFLLLFLGAFSQTMRLLSSFIGRFSAGRRYLFASKTLRSNGNICMGTCSFH